MKKMIICFTGLMASGKDVAKKYLEKNHQATSFRFSSVLRDALDCLNIEASRNNLINLSTWDRENFGNDLLAKAIAKKAEQAEAELVVIDGARRKDDLIYLKNNKDFHLIAIDADPKIRYERLVLRNENQGDDKKSYQDFLNDHQKETEISIPETMAEAKFSINNNGDLESLYKQIEEILKQL